MSKPEVNWSAHDQYPENEIECTCGMIYQSHSKHVNHEGKLVGVTRKPCPACGKDHDHIRAARSTPERQVLHRGDS